VNFRWQITEFSPGKMPAEAGITTAEGQGLTNLFFPACAAYFPAHNAPILHETGR
jgi:hypothetical protein